MITGTYQIMGNQDASVPVGGNGVIVNAGTVSIISQTSNTLSAGTTTLTPANGVTSMVLTGPSAGGTVTLNILAPDFADQRINLHIKQGATAATWNLNTGFAFGATVAGFTATATGGARDLIQLLAVDTTHWAVAAINQGLTV